MTVLLCLVRPGDDNDELRYAVRSWETNLILPDLRLVTVGYHPTWLKPDHHIEGNRFKSTPLAVFDNIRLGAETLTEEFLLMNDDFFCLDPVGSVLPVRRRLTLLEHLHMAGPAGSDLWYPASLRLTLRWLNEQRFPTPWSWEAHRPLPVRPGPMLAAIQAWKDTNLGQFDMAPQARTLYGTLNDIQGYPVDDCKLGTNSTGIGSPWVSTSDQSWRRFQTSIKKRFQKPSRWEI